MATPLPSQKDGQQVLKYAFDDASGKLRVDATITPSGTDLEIHNTDDSIAIGTSTQLFTATTVGPKISLDVNVSQSALPAGASTSALQTTGNTSLASIDTKLTSPLTINLPAGASTSALQTTGNNSLASIDAGIPAALGQTTLANSMPVAIASNQTAIPASQSGTWNINNVSGTVSLPTGAATAANQTTGNTSLSSIDSKLTSPLTINLPANASTASNQVTQINSLASIDSKLTSPLVVTGPLTDTQLRATPVPISAASLPLPTGAATDALQTTGNASLSSIDTKLTAPLQVQTVQLWTLPFDAITASYPSATQEIYQSLVGGIAGTVQQTITVNYTDSTKNFIQDIART